MKQRPIQIVGAGPAGLAAAITLARADVKVEVHEARDRVGWRFGADLQGLENWSEQTDVIEELKSLSMPLDFEYYPASKGMAFDAWRQPYEINTSIPLFYLIERGYGENSLDSALLRQATALGVKVVFNSRVRKVRQQAILATGPKQADAIAVGYHFKTTMQNGFWVICDNNLAPGGYAYLLVMNGRGTVKTCMFNRFKQEKQLVEKTVKAFEDLAGLEMIEPKKHGGAGNFLMPISAVSGRHPVVGEQAGFQDTLWGFGIRFAIRSGVMAANSLIQCEDYDQVWQPEFLPLQKTSTVNRVFYNLIGNRGYRWAIRRGVRGDIHQTLRKLYQPSKLKNFFFPLAERLLNRKRSDEYCHSPECECVWCKQCR